MRDRIFFNRADLRLLIWEWSSGRQTPSQIGGRAWELYYWPFGIEYDSRFTYVVLEAMVKRPGGVGTFTLDDVPLLEEALDLSETDGAAALEFLVSSGLLNHR